MDFSEAKKGGGATRWVAVGVIGVVVAVSFWQLARAGFDWRAVLEGANPWLFLLAMATLPVCGFPISACYIYAGMAFDLWTAALLCWSALAVNMSVSYWLTRTVLKAPLARLLARGGWKIPEPKGDNIYRVTFLVRTVPGPPFFFQNVGLGLAGIPFGTYLWVSLLAQGSIAMGVIYCTGTLSRDPVSVGGVVVLAILAALVVVKAVKWIQKRRAKAGTIKTAS